MEISYSYDFCYNCTIPMYGRTGKQEQKTNYWIIQKTAYKFLILKTNCILHTSVILSPCK